MTFARNVTRTALTSWPCVCPGVCFPRSTATHSGWGLWCHWAAAGSRSPPYTSLPRRPRLLSDTPASTKSWNDWEENRMIRDMVEPKAPLLKETNLKKLGTHPMLFSNETAPHISLPRLRLRGYAWQDWHLPLLEHTPCTLRAASLSICSLGLGLV